MDDEENRATLRGIPAGKVSAAVQVLPSAILADAARAETKGPALSGRASYLHLVVTRLKDRLYRQRQFQREGS